MKTPDVRARRADEAGFSILEIVVSMAIMLLVLSGTMMIMSNAMASQRTAKEVLDMNWQLRAAIDLIQRDLLQVGQGLPVGRRVGIPNGDGAGLIVRPGPAADEENGCPGVTTFPADTSIPAVSVGPELGPAINGQCSDVITILAADNMFGPVPVTAIAADGSSATLSNNVDPALRGDVLRPGDLLMFTKGSSSVLMQVTAVSDDGNTATFDVGAADPLGLNQFGDPVDGPLGTINRFKAAAPADYDEPDDVNGDGLDDSWSNATRLRMVTYFVDVETDRLMPRLVRVVGGGAPNAVGFGLQAFRITYDIADQAANATGVRMDETDMSVDGACSPVPCSENQIRKVNVLLSMRAFDPLGPGAVSQNYQGNHSQNTLFTQVSLRSMAFVDRYR
jgi:type II secretory pathway pseudopilin PulG